MPTSPQITATVVMTVEMSFRLQPIPRLLASISVGINPDLARRPRNSVFVKHIYVRHSSSIAPKRPFDTPSNANPLHHPANHTIFLQKFSNLINFHYLCGLFGKIYAQTKALNTNNLYNILMYRILVVDGNCFLNSLYVSN